MTLHTSQPSRLPQSERLARVRLARSSQIGPVTFRRLLEQFGAARTALDALPDIARKSGVKRPIVIATRQDTIAEIESALALSAKPVIWGDPEYPPALAAIEVKHPLLEGNYANVVARAERTPTKAMSTLIDYIARYSEIFGAP